ncbi:MAG: T9SS type A sorting domain-containing protein [Bacteroidota bacterium]
MGQSIFGVSGGNGVTVFTGYTSISKGILSSVKTKNDIVPVVFALYQNFPNPFNPSTTIRYGLPSASRVTLKIYNILGQQIAEIVNQEQSEGIYEVQWNANVATGLYFYRIEAASVSDPDHTFTQLKKMLVLK